MKIEEEKIIINESILHDCILELNKFINKYGKYLNGHNSELALEQLLAAKKSLRKDLCESGIV